MWNLFRYFEDGINFKWIYVLLVLLGFLILKFSLMLMYVNILFIGIFWLKFEL